MFIPFFVNHESWEPKSQPIGICWTLKDAHLAMINFFFDNKLYDIRDMVIGPTLLGLPPSESFSKTLSESDEDVEWLYQSFINCLEANSPHSQGVLEDWFDTFGRSSFVDNLMEFSVHELPFNHAQDS